MGCYPNSRLRASAGFVVWSWLDFISALYNLQVLREYINHEMKSLSNDARRCLDAAEGWLGLGDHVSANEELAQLKPELWEHPRVLALRLDICWAAGNWQAVLQMANASIRLMPESAHGWIGRSFALHELKRTQEAYDLLLPVRDKFPKNLTVPYNLACYCSRLNRLAEARDWFKQAMSIDGKTVSAMAADDPDLKPLRDSPDGLV